MRKLLYISQGFLGGTSRMRFDILEELLPDWETTLVDISVPFDRLNRLVRAIGFRWKIGPVVSEINAHICRSVTDPRYDVIWVDKGVYVRPETTAMLRDRTSTLIHFTPDPAFTFHRSKLFYRSAPRYDLMVTTKTYELDDYHRLVGADKTFLVTQGFDRRLHRPVVPFEQKHDRVVFIGHHERERGEQLEHLLEHGIAVAAGGPRWAPFGERHRDNPLFHFMGSAVFGEDYVQALSGSRYGLGTLTRWVPELHTTRTFEIPACGTALITERNRETEAYFRDDEAIFFDDPDDLVRRLRYFGDHPDEVKAISEKGRQRVVDDGFDYASILLRVLARAGITDTGG